MASEQMRSSTVYELTKVFIADLRLKQDSVESGERKIKEICPKFYTAEATLNRSRTGFLNS